MLMKAMNVKSGERENINIDPSRHDKSPYARVFILAAGRGRCDVSVTGVVTVFVTLSGIMSSLSLLRGLRGLKGPSDDGTDDGHQFTVSQGRKYLPPCDADLSKQICDKSSHF